MICILQNFPTDYIPVVEIFIIVTVLIALSFVVVIFLNRQRKVQTGREGILGEEGEAHTHILVGKEGKVYVHGELWNATSEHEVKRGDKVKVIGLKGMTLKVERI